MIDQSDLLDRVRGLASASNLALDSFARAIGIDAEHLASVLHDKDRFSSLDLALIADLHEVTVEWLLTGVPSVLMRGAHLPAGSARTLVEMADDLADRREGAARLGRPQRWRAVMEPSIGPPVEQGRVLAGAAVRRVEAAGREVTEADMPSLVEDVFGVDVAVCEVGSGVDGLAVRSPEAKVIVVAATADAARQRFTVAHELGRLLAGDDPEVLHLDMDVLSNGDDPAEDRADTFARSFLMPEVALRRAVEAGIDEAGFARLVGGLRVSPAALARRLIDLGLVGDETGRRWRAMPAAAAARTGGWSDDLVDAMGDSLAPRIPRVLRRDLYQVYEAGEATLRPFAWSLEMEPDRLREVLGPDAGASTDGSVTLLAGDDEAFFSTGEEWRTG